MTTALGPRRPRGRRRTGTGPRQLARDHPRDVGPAARGAGAAAARSSATTTPATAPHRCPPAGMTLDDLGRSRPRPRRPPRAAPVLLRRALPRRHGRACGWRSTPPSGWTGWRCSAPAPTCHRRRSGTTGPPRCARPAPVLPSRSRSSPRWFTPAFAHAAARRRGVVHRHDGRHRPGGLRRLLARSSRAMDQRDLLGRITAPTLVIAGAQDAATPPGATPSVIAGASRTPLLVTLDPAAHLAGVEQPGAVTALPRRPASPRPRRRSRR